MATPSIAAGENPVVFTASSAGAPRSVTVAWSTDSRTAGRVSRRVDDGRERVVGSGASGAVTSEIGLNQTQTFTLRSVLGQVLATLVVTTVLESAPIAVAAAQRIDISRAAVRADLVYLRWRTAVPVPCWVEIVSPGREHGYAGTETGTVHQVRFDGLDQDADYTVRILAEGGMSRYLAAVHTGTRSVTVGVERVEVRGADPHSVGLVVGDDDQRWGRVTVGGAVTVPHAPRHLRIEAELGATTDPDTGRRAPRPSAADRVDLHPELGPVSAGLRGVAGVDEVRGLTLTTERDGVTCEVHAVLRVRSSEGSWVPDPETFRRVRLRTTADSRVTSLTPGRSVAVDTAAGCLELRLSPEGVLFVSGPASGGGREHVLGGPFGDAVHACPADGSVVLVATDPTGAPAAAVVEPGRPERTEWHSFGRGDAVSVAAAPTAGGVAVLAVCGDGVLRCRVVSAADRPSSGGRWDEIGTGVVTATALANGELGLTVLAGTADGRVRHRMRRPDGGWGGWTSIGALPPSHLAAHWETPRCLAVTAVDADRIVRVLAWPGYPAASAPGCWTTVGTLAAVEEPADPPVPTAGGARR